jgi:putative tricarboxylic transport membrane protein
MPRALVIAPLVGAVVTAAFLPSTWLLDGFARQGQLGPGFWPRLALIGLGLACLAKVWEAWRRRPVAGGEARPLATRTLAESVALVVGYVAFTPVLGFPLATGAFIALFARRAGLRSWVALAANVLLGTVTLLYVFVKVVYLPLPKGDGPFEAVTLALYRALRLF